MANALGTVAPKLGFNIEHDANLDNTTENDVDAGPTYLHGAVLENDHAGTLYLKMWDNRAPVIGTTPEDIQIPIANGADPFTFICPGGLFFENGISYGGDLTKGTAAASDPTDSDLYLMTSAGRQFAGATGPSLRRNDLQTSISSTTVRSTHGSKLVRIDSLNENQQAAATAAVTMRLAILDNRNSPNAANYVKLYDSASAVTIGSTAPDVILYAPKGSLSVYGFPTGLAFANGVQFAGLTTGGTGGTTGPTTAFGVSLYV